LFQFEAYLNDGTVVELTDRVLVPVAFDVTGPTRLLLSTERLCLNVMQRMSGIATRTYEYQWLIAHTGCRVLDTRKTVPLNRHFDKWAVAIGGGKNHRIGLYDEVLIKDNHVDACGGIEAALTAVQVYFRKIGRRMPVVLEIRTLTELTQALAIGNFDRLLLDNFSVQGLAEALKMINRKYPTEASGNISRETIVSYAETGVDYISVGALTHSVQALDLSLKIATR
jgi:nicotinate-nucleotide pyrophosphorylase (carboxylating)